MKSISLHELLKLSLIRVKYFRIVLLTSNNILQNRLIQMRQPKIEYVPQLLGRQKTMIQMNP